MLFFQSTTSDCRLGDRACSAERSPQQQPLPNDGSVGVEQQSWKPHSGRLFQARASSAERSAVEPRSLTPRRVGFPARESDHVSHLFHNSLFIRALAAVLSTPVS